MTKLITLKAASTAVVGSILLFGYVASQWPSDVQELKIPPGKVELIPGTDHKGILVQGQRGSLALYYSVTAERILSSILADKKHLKAE